MSLVTKVCSTLQFHTTRAGDGRGLNIYQSQSGNERSIKLGYHNSKLVVPDEETSTRIADDV